MTLKQQIQRTTLRTAAALTLLEVTTHLPTEGRSSLTYHHFFDTIITPLGRRLFNPEDAHNLALEVVRRGLAPRLSREGNEAGSGSRINMTTTIQRTDTDGGGKPLKFPGPIGLAAGFDKNGCAISELFQLGFSFVEIGSVTPQPQDGNAKPRSFRLVEDRGVINRFGFNSLGADVVRGLLETYRCEFGGRGAEVALEKKDGNNKEESKKDDGGGSAITNKLLWALGWAWHRIMTAPPRQGILGVNLGKNKTSDDEIGDYTTGIRKLGPYADYLVINVSSPNTPGLRSLQQRGPLYNLLTSTMKARDEYAPHAPLYVKIAPDLSLAEMEDVAAVVMETGIDGMIVSNTTNARPESLVSLNKREVGGLSGAPIKNRSTECIRTMYKLTNGTIPIIGVGGVGSGRDAYDKLKAGASLIQVYSMMVYEGPGVVSRIQKELADILVENGYKNVEDVVGADCEDIYSNKIEARVKKRMVDEKRM
jgi:dihydroorotate dehydrogenase